MLKIENKQFQYHEKGQLILTAVLGETLITIGTSKINFKSGTDGFNHSDLAAGALANFFCWPPQKIIKLHSEETFIIDAFVAYHITSTGTYKKEGDFRGEVKFSVS